MFSQIRKGKKEKIKITMINVDAAPAMKMMRLLAARGKQH
jgi:hypothetical protein